MKHIGNIRPGSDSPTRPPANLTIVGLGPGAWEQLTLEARDVLAGATEIHLRTKRHPVVDSFPATLTVSSFDKIYDQGASFDEVYQSIVESLLELANRPDGVIYGVPGHPLVGEETVRRLLPLARSAGLVVRLVAGLSFLEPVFAALELDPLAAGLQIVDATMVASFAERRPTDDASGPAERDPFAGSYRPFDPTRPVLVSQVYGARMAGALKVSLLELYPPEHEVQIVKAAGMAGQERAWSVPLYELDRQSELDHLTSVYLAPLEPLADIRGFETFRRIVGRLRAPDGCPWDREQTHESLKRYVIEEAYEVVEALDAKSSVKLAEELGDLLLQIVLHAQVAIEADEFTLEDVIESIGAKLIRRHPHVFADVKVRGSDDVLRNWDQIKKAERAESGEQTSTLRSVPRALPALLRAETIQKRVARTGFDWEDVDHALAKVVEEVAEVRAAATPGERQAEFGDLLFALVGVARKLDVDAEEALRLGTTTFVDRFERLDQLAQQRGLDFARLSKAEMLALWDEAKLVGGVS